MKSLQKQGRDVAGLFEFRVGEECFVLLELPSLQPADTRLTEAECDVARLAAEGWRNEEIAAKRGTSERTVANQMASILMKLNLGSRIALAAWMGEANPTLSAHGKAA
jgi:DNA-binding NarL/FixJ family response regulator